MRRRVDRARCWFALALGALVAVSAGCSKRKKTGVDLPKYPDAVFDRISRSLVAKCSTVFQQIYRSPADGKTVSKWYVAQLESDTLRKWSMPPGLPTAREGTAVFRTNNMKPGIEPGPKDCTKPGFAVTVQSTNTGAVIGLWQNVPEPPPTD